MPSSTTANTLLSPSAPEYLTTALPTPPGLGNPLIPPPYLPQFPFGAHTELLHKSPFLPYDFPAFRHTRLTLSNSNSSSNNTSTAGLQTTNALSSPASSRPSSSSPQPLVPVTNKLNISLEIHSNSEDSDDEQIDVVKSAFVPILRPNHTISKVVELADSTTTNSTTQQLSLNESNLKTTLTNTTITSPSLLIKSRCELKAPSSKKPIHETAPTGPKSPDTKLRSATISTQKTVWRPY